MAENLGDVFISGEAGTIVDDTGNVSITNVGLISTDYPVKFKTRNELQACWHADANYLYFIGHTTPQELTDSITWANAKAMAEADGNATVVNSTCPDSDMGEEGYFYTYTNPTTSNPDIYVYFYGSFALGGGGGGGLSAVGDYAIQTSSGNYATAGNNGSFNLGTNPFTMDFWIKMQGNTNGDILSTGTGAGEWQISEHNNAYIKFEAEGTAKLLGTYPVNDNEWHHVAIVREGLGNNETKLYVDGVFNTSAQVDTNFSSSSDLVIGNNFDDHAWFDGIRITNDEALWTEGFETTTSGLMYPNFGASRLLSTYYKVTADRRIRGKASEGWIRPTLKQFFTTYPDFKEVPGRLNGTGGTTNEYSANGKNYRVHTFTESGSLEILSGASGADILIIGGGGSGGHYYYAGGGGAGGVVYYKDKLLESGIYTATVGAGGAGGNGGGGNNGENSSFGNLTVALGGGSRNADGGSGGGGGVNQTGGVTLDANQGNDGGSSYPVVPDGYDSNAGGGGGAGGPGFDALFTSRDIGQGGNGGIGVHEGADTIYNHTDGSMVLFEINGLGQFYAAGGGGSTGSNNCWPGIGGSGIGGNGGAYSKNIKPTDGVANTGSGGGGATHTGVSAGYAGAGGSGIIIVRYEI